MSRRLLALVVHLMATVAAAAAIAGAAPSARAEDASEQIVLDPGNEAAGVSPRLISIDVRWALDAQTSTGWGFVRVDLTNSDAEARTVRVRVSEWPPAYASTHRAGRSVRLEPGAHERLWLPRLSGSRTALEVGVPGRDSVRLDAPAWSRGLLRALVVGERPQDLQALADHLSGAAGVRSARSAAGTMPIDMSLIAASDLPPLWTYLTAASIVVVDGAAKGLEDAERQQTLVRYARAGGTLLVLDRGALPHGPLADALAEVAPASVSARTPCGFGSIVATNAKSVAKAQAVDVVDAWTSRGKPAGGDTVVEASSVLTTGLGLSQNIPGVGRVPVRAFFFVLLLFAVLVGPVAYLVLKRRRRLIQMIVVAPAAGLFFAGTILLWGLLSDGLGTRGAVKSFTILDQREHEATCVAGRTLFSGIGPDTLRLSPDTAIYAPGVPAIERDWTSDRRTSTARFDFDADTGRLDGGALPSRTVTSFSTTSRARARERLRFRRLSDDRYEVLSTADFAPVNAPGSIVFRAPDGRYFGGDGSASPLVPITQDVAEVLADHRLRAAEFSRLDDDFDPMTSRWTIGYRSAYWNPWEPTIPTASDRSVAATRAVPRELAPGSYLAWMTSAPGFDDLGLDVRWESRSHLVVGLLAKDDIE